MSWSTPPRAPPTLTLSRRRTNSNVSPNPTVKLCHPTRLCPERRLNFELFREIRLKYAPRTIARAEQDLCHPLSMLRESSTRPGVEARRRVRTPVRHFAFFSKPLFFFLFTFIESFSQYLRHQKLILGSFFSYLWIRKGEHEIFVNYKADQILEKKFHLIDTWYTWSGLFLQELTRFFSNKREVWRVKLAVARVRKVARTLLTLDEKDPRRLFEGKTKLENFKTWFLRTTFLWDVMSWLFRNQPAYDSNLRNIIFIKKSLHLSKNYFHFFIIAYANFIPLHATARLNLTPFSF